MSGKNSRQLQEIRDLLRSNTDVLKPYFGMVYWQLIAMEGQVRPEDFLQEGGQLTLREEQDETIAAFISTFMQLWESAGDLNVASRFVADGLGMSADELIQSRMQFLEAMAKSP